MSYEINYQDHVLNVKFTGHITTEELLALDKTLFEQWALEDCIGHIYDYLDVASVGFCHEEIKRIALLDKNESFVQGELKIAIVVIDENVAKYSRLYADSMEGGDWLVKVVPDQREANHFIFKSPVEIG